MSKKDLGALRESFLAKGYPDGEAIWQGYMDRWAVVKAQAEADAPLVQEFLAACGTEPQAIRALNLVAQKSGSSMIYRDASVTHEAPAVLQ
jgi:hypothetical protein